MLRHMGVRRLLLCFLVLATSCSSDPSSSPGPSTVTQEADASRLVGRWTVAGEGVVSGTKLILRNSTSVDQALFVDLPCGQVGGPWAADGEQSLFVGDAKAGASSCFDDDGPRDVGWLARAVGFRVVADTALLVDSQGRTVVTLRPIAPSSAEPAETPIDAKDSLEPRPLPENARPPSNRDLLRRWVPQGARAGTRAFVEFAADGSWHGSDGCNGKGGRYVLGAAGRLLATGGPQTLVGCENSPIGNWVESASRAGLVADDLVFYDGTGKELGRAVGG